MKYTETAAGGAISLSAAELCCYKQQVVLSKKEITAFAFLPDVKQNVHKEALIEHNNIRYLLRCEPEGYFDGDETQGRTVVEFFVMGPQKVQAATRKPSLHAFVCAAIIAAKDGCPVTIRRVLLDRDMHSVVSFADDEFPAEELLARLHILLSSKKNRAEYEIKRPDDTIPAIKKLKFPHSSLRPGQKELIERVYTAAKQGERLFASAPTGIGKTVSVMYGAVRAMGGGGFRRIFYLTAKNSTRREAFASAAMLNGAGANLRTVVLAAKDSICPMKALYGPEHVCLGEDCPLMKGYGPKSAGAILELLEKHRGYPVSTVKKAAEKAGVCPYEFSLDLSEYCDIIICDYNSVFDPAVKLQRYFTYGDPHDSMLLIDEAHNLPARARDTFSATIRESDLTDILKYSHPESRIHAMFEDFASRLSSLASLCEENSEKDENGLVSGWYFSSDSPTVINEAVDFILPELIVFRASHKSDPEAYGASSAILHLLSKWQNAALAYDSHYRTYISLDRGVISAKLFCLDPSERLGETLSAVRASVFFSATLSPEDYFADILGSKKDSSSLSLPSPFPRENLFLAAVTSIGTRYDEREKSAKKICAAIAASVSAKKGNYMVFFPSYAYLREVTKLFTEKYPNVKVRIQTQGMTHKEREAFLDFFEDDKGVLRIGFCVLGGSFSEGVDLPGGRLIGTVIVGVGLPGLSAEGNIIRDYYETRSECGFDYAYTYPGMNSVLQAAGRVIRRESDTGAVVLIDNRYATEKYRALMPPHWDKLQFITDLHDLQTKLAEFWGKK